MARRKRISAKTFFYLAYTTLHYPLHAWPKDIAKYKGKYDKGYNPYKKHAMSV
ncbi:MAG: hypothetical protein AAGA18_05870 [Verrucomicrobiota bacterium]